MNAILCTNCGGAIELAALSAAGKLVCAGCYLADPPAADVDGIFAEVTAHMTPAIPPASNTPAEAPAPAKKPRAPRKPKADRLPTIDKMTQLGQALGCAQVEKAPIIENSTYTEVPDSNALLNSVGFNSGPCAKPEPESKLPACCWYTGPLAELGPAPLRAPKVSIEQLTMLDLDAIALARRGREDLIQYMQMRARYAAARKAPAPAMLAEAAQ
jgi:hypothetical protein